MTVGAAEPLGGYDIARRDLPWRNAGVRAGLDAHAWTAVRGGLVRGLEKPC